MQLCALFVVVAISAAPAVQAVTPIQKVVQLMQEMQAKGEQAKKEEAVAFSAFSQFCTDTRASKTGAIERAASRLEQLDADIAEATAEIERLGKRIAELEEDVARWQTDKKSATDVREKEKADYGATHADYVDVVDALQRAIQVLKSNPTKIAQTEVLLQASALTSLKRLTTAARVPAEARRTITAFLQQTQDPMLLRSGPEAHGYESHSGGIIDMLAELLDRFSGEQRDLEREEQAANANYESLMQKLRDQGRLAEQEIARKTE